MAEATSSTNSAQFRIAVFAVIFDEDQCVLLAHRRDIDWWNLRRWRHGTWRNGRGGGMSRGARRDWLRGRGKVSGRRLFKAAKAGGSVDFQLSKLTGGVLTATEEFSRMPLFRS